MRILLTSYAYAPAFGGIETVSRLLAREWHALGHEVRVITTTPGDPGAPTAEPWPVVRDPSTVALLQALRWCDVFFQNNLSLRLARAWPLAPKPWITCHQTWLVHPGRKPSLSTFLKHRSLPLGHSVAISHAIAAQLPAASTVIVNPYDAQAFSSADHTPSRRTSDVAFVGRWVSDKGADLLIEALTLLQRANRPMTATFIGAGPEEASLRAQVLAAGLGPQVTFAGRLEPHALAAALRTHRVLVVPSRWPEPFGIVALEGLAAGCRVVVADRGGLPEAVGALGRVFTSGCAASLATALDEESSAAPLDPARVATHLARFAPARVAAEYLQLFRRVLS
jgi:glycogen synthase